MDTDGFSDLVQQAEQLTADMDSGGELPRVERNLHQIMEAASRMATRTPHLGLDSSDVKASLLLGSRGYDIKKISQNLEGLSATKTFEPLEPVRDTDIQGFLKNERENALLSAIEQTRKNTFNELERRHWESIENEWEREKQRILNALVGTAGDALDFPQDTEQMVQDSISMGGRSTMDANEMAYARQVYLYNDQVVQGGVRPSLCSMFAEAAETMDVKNVSELWMMVGQMTEVPLGISANLSAARTSNKVMAAFVNKAMGYLEQTYVKYITTSIYGHLQQAQLGGVPGTFYLVRSFLNVHLPGGAHGLEDGLVEGHPVWAMLYYCIRCGDMQAATQVIDAAAGHLGDFASYIQEYMKSAERRLSHSSETKLRLQYKRSIRNSTDPYKRAVYCVIGRCDPTDDHTEVASKIDDYLWIKLSQLTYDDSTSHSTGDQLTLPQLQTMLLEEYGETHFNAYQQPFLYCQVLLLTAQFEAAVEFMSRIERLRCHVVHVALVLYELKMLLQPQSIQAQLLSKDPADPTPLRRLNFARLITMYTRKFEATDPREALQYFYFLRDLTAPNGDSLFRSCISEVVLETREFDLLLGQIGRDGTRKPGAIDKYHADTQRIIELVARDAESKGLAEDAVKLYDLAKNHEKVLQLMNKLLTQVLSQPPSPQSTKDRLRQVAISVAERYRAQGHEGSRHTTSTFYLLLDLITFFDLFHTGKVDEAYNVIQNLKLLPFTVETVDQKVNAFKHYTDEIRRSLPEILLATMNILHAQYKAARSSGAQSTLVAKDLSGIRKEDGGKESYINYLRSQARALITFAGTIPYRMPGDTNARLVQLEVLMN